MKRTEFIKSRREFIGTSAILATGLVACGTPSLTNSETFLANAKPNSLINGVQIGCQTYSFRSMQDQSAEATLQYVLDAGINAIELMGAPAETFAGAPINPINFRDFYSLRRKKRNEFPLNAEEEQQLTEMEIQRKNFDQEMATWRTSVSMDKFIELKKMYLDAGVQIYAFKPQVFDKNKSLEEIDYGFRVGKALGVSHVTLEHPEDDEHTQLLGEMALKHKIYVAYHGHEQQTPILWDTALEQSEYNAMNIDIGHYVAAGNPLPLKIIKEKNKNIQSMHLKDRTSPENGRKNLAFGKGDTPIRDILLLTRDNQYKFPLTVELEYEIPEGSDAVKEVKKCVAYCRQILES